MVKYDTRRYYHARKRQFLYVVFICTSLLFLFIVLFIFYREKIYFNNHLRARQSGHFTKACWIIRNDVRLLESPATGKMARDLFYYPPEDIRSPFVSPFIIQDEDLLSNNLSSYSSSSSSSSLSNADVEYLVRRDTTSMIKTIAIYKSYSKSVNGPMKDTFKYCPYKNCRMTRDVYNADAVVFMPFYAVLDPNFRRKRQDQVWVFQTTESPSRLDWFSMLKQPTYRRTMNLSVSYRLDSDLKDLYGKLVRVKKPPEKDYTAIFKGKSKMAAWFVSHCRTRSERMKFVQRMRSRMDVDIFGACGNETCRNKDADSWGKTVRERADEKYCNPVLSSTYKFYLAFENTMCKEYVTEKFFKLFLAVDVVPVVRGGADYQALFPRDMYVDASDFSTPEGLADHLLDLASDQARYVQLLKNKDRYRSVSLTSQWRCELCRSLHQLTETGQSRTYSNIHHWWTADACFDPRDARAFW